MTEPVETIVFYVYASEERRKAAKQPAPPLYTVEAEEEKDENGDVFDRVLAPIAPCEESERVGECYFCGSAVVREYVEARWPSGPAKAEHDFEWGFE